MVIVLEVIVTGVEVILMELIAVSLSEGTIIFVLLPISVVLQPHHPSNPLPLILHLFPPPFIHPHPPPIPPHEPPPTSDVLSLPLITHPGSQTPPSPPQPSAISTRWP